MDSQAKRQKRIVRHRRVRAKVSGTSARPRLSVFRSGKHVFLQIIDDTSGKTLVSASSAQAKGIKGKGARALAAAKTLAEKAGKAGVLEVVFDRGGYKYQGRVEAVAKALRESGIKF